MSIGDQAQNKAEELAGQAKDKVGGLADDGDLQAEGKADQATANVKQAGEQVKRAAADVASGVKEGHGVLNRLHKAGFRSEFAYIGAFASIGLSLASWFASRNRTGSDKAQADRWGIFVGHWAPTFMALGVGLKLEESE